jgi:hypothetical protein
MFIIFIFIYLISQNIVESDNLEPSYNDNNINNFYSQEDDEHVNNFQNFSKDDFYSNYYREEQNKDHEKIIYPEFKIDEKTLDYDDSSELNTFYNSNVYYDLYGNNENESSKNQNFLKEFNNFCD